MKVISPDLGIRPAAAGDQGFIVGTWLASFRLSRDAGQVPMATYKATYDDAIRRLLCRRRCVTLVACHPAAAPGDADLYGFICAEPHASPPAIHYVYVIAEAGYRRRGIARRLVEATGIDLMRPWRYTYRTGALNELSVAGKLGSGRWASLYARDEERADG